jgi:hypothetical protein
MRAPLFLFALGTLSATLAVSACSSASSTAGEPADGADASPDPGTGGNDSGTPTPMGDAGPVPGKDAGPPKIPCASPAACEQAAQDNLMAASTNAKDLAAFVKGMPKGADLHNHLSGAVYAETYLDLARKDGDCINQSTYSAVFANQCSASNVAAPSSGAFFDQIVAAWSMQGFVPGGAQTGHDHFFATFGKYGAIAGAHRDDSIADIAKRAADENQLYVETMFNLGKNVGTVAAAVWKTTVTADVLQTFYDALLADPGFAGAVANDVAVVNDASTRYRTTLGCAGASKPAACDVGVRFVAQVSRTGALDQLFGQLVSAFEMAQKTPGIVALNLSSPEDDTASLKNYDVHMAMLDFLYQKYTVTKLSPLHVTLHAGELAPKFLPAAYPDANTFHIRKAVELGHAERIGHGLDILSETDSPGLLAEMKAANVLVEVCLSSNVQILEVSGMNHPLSAYLAAGVPVALATDDQGVSRSSLAGEYARAVTDQKLGYRDLKTLGRNSLEHAFLPGDSLWTALGTLTPVTDCAPTAAMALGGTPSAACQAFLDGSERATKQWELERRYVAFEAKQ